jgi:hypothetical protein
MDEIRGAYQLLPDYKMNHVRREPNEVAHVLAQRALKHRECVVKRFNVPECVCRRLEVEAVQGGSTHVSCNDPVQN